MADRSLLRAEELQAFINIRAILLDVIRHLEAGTARDRINIADHLNRPQCSESPVPPRIFLGDRGRPRYLISRDQVEFLLERCFSVVDIASLLGVSVRTLERRLSEFGLRARSTYSDISDQALDNLMRNILTEFPNTGYKRMTGFLQARGLRIQQSRIREAMRRVNPVGVLLRALELRTIHRRRYQVYGLLALWHIDGNHKLIRWRFVIHGAIDGYSRMIVYLQCNTNNCAATVLTLFQRAIQTYGLPSRVRSEKGGENVDVYKKPQQKFWRETCCLIFLSSHQSATYDTCWHHEI
ncbi:hypothetical protein P5673_003276 [Acropora cervicornis]|uniref:Integrase core domain-containing protein n=1 Tax=Acropora cervicornis TaxID=6130 RepID=A0AAD9R2Y4_ACRCE|nr:hypothetical protein P5673_003276 [Acropora cervicornis]